MRLPGSIQKTPNNHSCFVQAETCMHVHVQVMSVWCRLHISAFFGAMTGIFEQFFAKNYRLHVRGMQAVLAFRDYEPVKDSNKHGSSPASLIGQPSDVNK